MSLSIPAFPSTFCCILSQFATFSALILNSTAKLNDPAAFVNQRQLGVDGADIYA